jgi:hypothetical protein
LRLTFLPQGSGLPETIAMTLIVLGVLGLLIAFGILFPLLRQEQRSDEIFMREAKREAAEAAPPPHH